MYKVILRNYLLGFSLDTSESSHSSRRVSFIIPFQLSPVAILNRVKYAIPKDLKWACSPSPWHGWSSSHSRHFIFYNFKVKILVIPSLPKSSTPSAAKMKNRRKKRRPRFPTWGSACITVSSRERIPLAIFNSFSTRAILKVKLHFTFLIEFRLNLPQYSHNTNYCWVDREHNSLRIMLKVLHKYLEEPQSPPMWSQGQREQQSPCPADSTSH